MKRPSTEKNILKMNETFINTHLPNDRNIQIME
jgi:hypothetical protein